MRPPVLIVLHGELSTPGRVAIQLRNRDIPLDVRRPRFGDDLPKTLEAHSGAVIFGGPQSANDDDEIVKREIDWIGVPLKEKKPFLGICLGAQMLAKQLGARVYKHADGHAEVGYYPIRPTAEGRAVCKDWPDHVYQWHREGFDLPDRAVMLAEGDSFPVQAFSYGGTAYALQFHMDVTHATMCRWTTRGHERMTLPNAKPREIPFRGPADARPGLPGLAVRVHRSLAQGAEPAKSSSKEQSAQPKLRRPRFRRRSPRAPMAAAVSAGRCRGFRPGRAGEHLSPDQHHQQRADAADHHGRNGAEPRRHQAGAEIAELVRRDDEQRVHRAHPPAHVVGGFELDQGHADDDADHVGDAQHGEQRHRQHERVRQREDDDGDAVDRRPRRR